MLACTIVAKNYLPFARVLARTFAAHHPGAPKFSVLIIDEEGRDTDWSQEPFEVLRLSDLKLGGELEAMDMATIYDVMELATAVKPWLLELLLDRIPAGITDPDYTVMYIDPDIQVFGDLSEAARLASRFGIVLTPHLTAGIPDDGKLPDELTILASGVYNLGFIAISGDQSNLLGDWKSRLRRDCIVDHEGMNFVDQRIMDFGPSVHGAYILRDPGWNVAYWNLGTRRLSWDKNAGDTGGVGQAVVTEEGMEGAYPLRFFHFSGFNPLRPHLLSKHQGAFPRVLLSERPDVAIACERYSSLLSENGFGEKQPAYAYGKCGDLELDTTARRLYRKELLASERSEVAHPPNPFVDSTPEEFTEWLRSPSEMKGAPGRLGRYLYQLLETRPDLQAAFPDADGSDLRRFVEWALQDGEKAPGVAIDPKVIGPREVHGRHAGPGQKAASPPNYATPTVRVAGYLDAELGVGEQGRLVVEMLDCAGIASATYAFRQTSNRQDVAFRQHLNADEFGGTGQASNPSDINIVVINSDRVGQFAKEVGVGLFESYTVGHWAWEVEEFPEEMHEGFAWVDEIWTVSDFARKAIAAKSPVPVYSVPNPVKTPLPLIGLGKKELGLPESFTFLFCFDMFSIFERKNPLGLIRAFKDAFSEGEGPVLVIKTINGIHKPNELELMKYLADGRKDIVVIDGYLSVDEKASLMDSCDCYVSLHRAEGFGLTLSDAMALGKPVIATDYSGNLEFMDDSNSYLVTATMTEIPAGCEPYPRGSVWASPDEKMATQLMRKVFYGQEEAKAIGAKAQMDVQSKHSVEARSELVASRINEIRAELGGRRSG